MTAPANKTWVARLGLDTNNTEVQENDIVRWLEGDHYKVIWSCNNAYVAHKCYCAWLREVSNVRRGLNRDEMMATDDLMDHVRRFQERMIGAQPGDHMAAMHALKKLPVLDAVRVVLFAACHPDTIVSDRELGEFVAYLGIEPEDEVDV